MSRTEQRELRDLAGVGKEFLKDFDLLGIHSVEELCGRSPRDLYDRMCGLTKSRQDPCVYDVFACAIAQAEDPNLPADECKWWTWSGRRKSTGPSDL